MLITYLITGFGTALMLNSPGLETVSRYCRCETAGTQTYSLYFKCPPTQQMRYPVKAYPRPKESNPSATSRDKVAGRNSEWKNLSHRLKNISSPLK